MKKAREATQKKMKKVINLLIISLKEPPLTLHRSANLELKSQFKKAPPFFFSHFHYFTF